MGGAGTGSHGRLSFCYTARGPFDSQRPFDVAVVIPTTMRPTLRRAVESIYGQDLAGRIQVLIGIDTGVDEPDPLRDLAPPPNFATMRFWPGYSTSARHGGLARAGDGGALRTVLTHLANAPLVAYLDDDNWWAPDHLRTLRQAIEGVDWAYAHRWFCHPETHAPIRVDDWESTGPGGGIFAERFGGFVDPSCLMIDKTRCPGAAQCWAHPLVDDPMSADRTVFAYLSQNHASRGSGAATAFYVMNPSDGLHEMRAAHMGSAYQEAGVTIDGYVEGVMARAEAHRVRKAEQMTEAEAAKQAALDDAARYEAAMELTDPDDAAHA